MLNILENILTPDEIDYYLQLPKNNLEQPKKDKGYRNWYIRNMLTKEEMFLIKSKLEKKNLINNTFKLDSAWINIVNKDTNKNDEYHKDNADRTIIIYLNENFLGGEFEYIIRGESYKIIPKTGLSLSMDNELFHKVNSVINGTRYSLVVFIKKEKTLL